MLNSFLIKNADTSFDHYYSSMKKRKAQQATNMTSTIVQQQTQVDYGKHYGKKPAARDGHTGIVY